MLKVSEIIKLKFPAWIEHVLIFKSHSMPEIMNMNMKYTVDISAFILARTGIPT